MKSYCLFCRIVHRARILSPRSHRRLRRHAAASSRAHRPHRRRPAAGHLARRRLGLHRRSLLLRALQLSSRGEEERLVSQPKAQPGDPFPTEYDFSKAPTLKVPGDWNTQRESLFFYEGPVWYERDFTYQPKEHTRVFLHVGAANYKSWFWVNGQKVCEHEGGYTSFNCEVTAAIHAGDNFVVAAVDNTRHEDGVPTLETDWWNYGGLTRSVSLIEVPEAFIDQYDCTCRIRRQHQPHGNDLAQAPASDT